VPWILTKGRYTSLFQKKEPTPKRSRQQELTTATAEVLQMLEQCKKGQSVRPGEFWARLALSVEDTLYEHLATKAPHDSHEFFLFLLETLHDSTALDVDMRILRPPPQTPQEHCVYGALQAWQREFSKSYSPFVDLFFGLMHWRTTCQACGNVSDRWESFNSIKAVVPKGGLAGEAPTLASMIEAELEPETIEGYHCDKCPQRTTAKRVARIWRLPQVIVVVLKRFTPDGRKIHTRMAALDGGSADPTFQFTPFFSDDSPEKAGSLHYSLRAIVDHHGGANGGHYTAQTRAAAAAPWVLFDDENLMELAGGPAFGDSTYMLFFERKT
jgi:ubiquitin C-terminal hydrolase